MTKKNKNKDNIKNDENKAPKKVNKKVILSIILSFVLISIAIATCFMFFIPNVKLLGDRIITIKLKEEYYDKGIKATYQGKDISKQVKVKDNINSEKVGTYKVTYTIKKGLFEVKKTRTVKVIDDTKPVIELVGEKEIVMCPGKTFDELGYSATDNYDGNLTSKVQIDETEEKITYTVKDSSGNKTVAVRKFIRNDIEKPIIALKGDTTLYIEQGGVYNEPGYTATDNCEADMTSSVIIDGKIDTNTLGTQTLTYKVIDKAGNESTANRVVYIKSPKVTAPTGIYKNSMIYLTFDDGPSNVTGQILDILKEKNVKATFFVVNQSDGLNYLIKREHDEGHTVALHSSSHRYDLIYSSVDNYFNDLNLIGNKVKNITGTDSKIIRFPGGGSNVISKKYSSGIMSTLTNEVLARGYHYFDWNVDCGDAGNSKNATDVYNNVVNYLSHNQTNVVLMHDFQNNYKTLEALDDIIDYGIANGYTFAAIDMNTPLVRHRVNN
ncbi:MAG: DUF5011 domain-containing protein [Bacilli bacterium]|nr:DUF5011 domain-containing protein [Bacilli bacterium]